MDNLRHTIDILFRYRRPENIRSVHSLEKSEVRHIDEKWFKSAYCHFYPKCSDDEAENICRIIDTTWMYPLKNEQSCSHCKNVFYIFTHFTSEVLCEKDGVIECRFEHLLRWHEMADSIGEDILTTSFLAYRDSVRGIENRCFFSWPWHINTDCKPLNDLYGRGLTDLHYHLQNSYPIFDLNWISLMNLVCDRTPVFSEIESSLCPQVFFGNKAHVYSSLQSLCIRAAVIRYKLFKNINNIVEEVDDDKWLTIDDDKLIKIFQYDLQFLINRAKYQNGLRFGNFIPDYFIPRRLIKLNLIRETNAAFSIMYGERMLLYSMFKKIYDAKANYYEEELFYEYLLIKSRFREEMVQINNHIGFNNFKQYQDRKNAFIKDTPYEDIIPYLSIHSSVANGNVRHIEARERLGESYREMVRKINKSDRLYSKTLLSRDDRLGNLLYGQNFDILRPHYYILQLHKGNRYFIDQNKRNEDSCGVNYTEHQCLNYKLRTKLQKIAFAYKDLRISSNSEKNRVVGIDAVSSEYGCRPEIFGQLYRYLRNYSAPCGDLFSGLPSLSNVGFTYHVGEDFLDLTDGLRAIDEALLFLELQNGDRIGHGLALGIAADEYYRTRQNTIVLPAQDMLDNVVWMFFKCRELGVNLPVAIERLFSTIYFELLNYIYPLFCSESIPPPYVYFQSMLLRGDAPSLYQMEDGNVKVIEKFFHFWDKCGCAYNNPEIITARHNKVARKLYYYYQYDWQTKQRGYKEVKFPKEYPAVISQIQIKMMKSIAHKGIGIETNPSSNFKIAQLQRYDKHPIAKFYNLGLTHNETELRECPQISVSINTDDQGLFSTSIENEYALLAAAMIKKTDAEGNPCYTERMVFDWLERIRQLGWEQRFHPMECH